MPWDPSNRATNQNQVIQPPLRNAFQGAVNANPPPPPPLPPPPGPPLPPISPTRPPSDGMCTICQDDFGNQELAKLKCGDSFHSECLRSLEQLRSSNDAEIWGRARLNRCPNCMAEYNPVINTHKIILPEVPGGGKRRRRTKRTLRKTKRNLLKKRRQTRRR
jgi:hypothetical protein